MLIATAILAIVFSYMAGAIIQGGFLQQKAPIYSQASLLTRGAVLDVEAEYASEGFPENDVSNEHCELPRDAGRDYECEYDLEKLDVDESELGQMAANLLEQLMAGAGDNGSILQAFQVLAFLFIQGDVPISPACPATPSELLQMCQVNLQVIEQNIFGMVQFFPRIIVMAAEQTRKLRIRIKHRSLGDEPVLEVETFIISIPEELRMLGKQGTIPDPTSSGIPGIPGAGAGQPKSGQPAKGSTPAAGSPTPAGGRK